MGRFSRAIVAIGIVAALAACSSSAKPRVDVNKVLTKSEYIQASNDICDTYRDRINGVVNSAGSGLTLSQVKDIWTTQLIPLFQAEHKELVALKAPQRDAKTLRAALVAMNSGINTIIGRIDSATSTAEIDTLSHPHGLSRWKLEFGKYGSLRCGPKPGT